MSNLAIGSLGVAALLAVLFVRVPIGVALVLVGAGGYAVMDGWRKALFMLGSVPFELASAYSLSVVPLFILMGAIASRAGMSRELFDAANAVFSGFRGALTNATIGACAAFGSICGSSIATAATFSRVAIPEMRRHGYEEGLAAGSVAAAGCLGILIPPSVILAIYSLVAEESLPKLFAAALFPGLLLAALYIVVVMVIGRLRPQWTPKEPAMPVLERLRAARYMWKLALLFFLAVGGIYLGWFSPTEAAAIAAFAAALIGFATRTLSLRGLADALLDTVYSTAMLFFIIAGAFIFSRFIVLTRLPNELAAWVQASGLGPLWIVAAVVALYFLLGTFLEEVSTILITVPVILPLMAASATTRCGSASSSPSWPPSASSARRSASPCSSSRRRTPTSPPPASTAAPCPSSPPTSCWWCCWSPSPPWPSGSPPRFGCSPSSALIFLSQSSRRRLTPGIRRRHRLFAPIRTS